jgi:isopentenyl-diphosphate delta-isomerase
MRDSTNERKVQHIRIIRADDGADRRRGHFDDLHLTHRALPELDLAKIDSSVVFMGKKLSFPLLISCMTGGDHDLVRKINRNLALAAEQTGVALGVGSQRVMFSNRAARSSFALRRHAPRALLFSNLGAVQLNKGFTLRHCEDAVEAVGADALCLHLNPLQEAVQPEGDTNFAGLARKIGQVARKLSVPVVLKEVGSGISAADARLAVQQGIRYVDVAGAGGTSWSRIEHHRQARDAEDDLGLVFQDWGLPTPVALEQLRPFRRRITIIASGGIRTGVDMVKSMILGASLCGLASPFLRPAMESAASVAQAVERVRRQFVTALFVLGVGRARDLIGREDLIVHRRNGPS